ncbi:protein strawberry notch homolog 1-like isoform X1 [Branchiostoma floridae]|uniref:Protein strawberry notch homolog 1 n=2 Tax=Branchiostoma floridae TaxID=7739 RepID=A0A9J7N6M6_BRAFL|nr:protein strawberry notch homolog 1-like isoform X1 [Branchiostoma floridae]
MATLMGDSSFDLLSAALDESGLAFDANDILNPPTDAGQGSGTDGGADPGSVLAQAMAVSGLEMDPNNDPLLMALRDDPAPVSQAHKKEEPRVIHITATQPPIVSRSAVTTVVTNATTGQRVIHVPVATTGVLRQQPSVTKVVTRPVSTTIPKTEQNRLIANLLSDKAASRNVVSVSVPRRSSSPNIQVISLPRTPGPNSSASVYVRTLPSNALQRASASSSVGSSVGNRVFSSIGNVASSHTVTSAANGSVKKELTGKDVSRLWANEDIKMRSLSPTPGQSSQAAGSAVKTAHREEEEEEEEEEELGVAETYAEYTPSKLDIGLGHPDSVVETSSLSSVQPPDVWYKLAIPEHIIDYGYLSALQLEAITYACQQHEIFLQSGERAGFLIGDGAGVGKGRTIAGIIYENYLLGRKRSLWLSVSNDLKVDAERDLKDIGAKVSVHSLNKFKYHAKISSKENGGVKKGVTFATYSSLIGESQGSGKYRTRMQQILHWCGEDFDGVIVFDECHKAKNLCPVGSSKPTKTGLTVLELQNRLPKARIVYASATGASEPKNMAYMSRLGIWGEGTPFREFNDFIQAVERRGVGAMEIVAMDMKLRGMYMARQLSFAGVSFKIEEIPLEDEFITMYDAAVKLWVDAREYFQKAAELIDAEHRMRKSMWGQFWSAHQRFFKYLCIASKVKPAVRIAREAVKSGKCIVIGLQSTGEARTLEELENQGGELNDFVSTAKGVFQTLIEKHFPAPDRRRLSDIFGLDFSRSSSRSSSPDNTPIPGEKRKRDTSPLSVLSSKKGKMDNKVSGGSDSDSDSSTSDSDNNVDSDEDDFFSPKHGSSDEDDDFNPFGSGSDEDDPWLSRIEKRPPKKEKTKSKPKKLKKSKSLDPASLDSSNNSTPKSANSLRKTAIANAASQSKIDSTPMFSSMDAADQAQAMKKELLDRIEKLGGILPPNTLDELIDDLGGPENVAEMTGRKGRVVSNDEGTICYESRSATDVPLEILNLTEKQRFMDGEKNIAIISEAASSGISLQADKRVQNQRRRVHITLELPWSADRAIQQFGRTHRSNQVYAPEYMFLISELAGERRFASIVAKRLESLGALTHGDRRAGEARDLSRFNIDTKYGRTALEAVMKAVVGLEPPIAPPPEDYQGNFFHDILHGLIGVGLVSMDERLNIPNLDKDYNSMPKFLNRILGLTVNLQNGLFAYFLDTLHEVIQRARRDGRYDMGILDLGSGGDHVRLLETKRFKGSSASRQALVELHTLSVERGVSWKEALDLYRELVQYEEGFYLSKQVRNMKCMAVLVKAVSGRRKLYSVHRPNTGQQMKNEPLDNIKKKYKKVTPDEAEPHWVSQYNSSLAQCSHAYWRGNCKRVSLGLSCEIGLRRRTYHVLSGSVLQVWSKVESVLVSMPGSQSKMQVVRIKTQQGKKVVGTLIPGNCIPALVNVLSQNGPTPTLGQPTTTQGQPTTTVGSLMRPIVL